MSGFDHDRVRRFCRERGHVRSDGRVMRLNNRPLLESFRNTLANWLAHGVPIVPLGRWDELLMSVDLMLWEYEAWELEIYGDLSYTEDEVPTIQTGASHVS